MLYDNASYLQERLGIINVGINNLKFQILDDLTVLPDSSRIFSNALFRFLLQNLNTSSSSSNSQSISFNYTLSFNVNRELNSLLFQNCFQKDYQSLYREFREHYYEEIKRGQDNDEDEDEISEEDDDKDRFISGDITDYLNENFAINLIPLWPVVNNTDSSCTIDWFRINEQEYTWNLISTKRLNNFFIQPGQYDEEIKI